MAWNDPLELIVAANGQVSTAPVGTALPTTPTEALNAAFVGLGYLTEDGVKLTITPDVTDFRAWQSQQAVRRERKAQECQAEFAMEQWNESTVSVGLGGGVMSTPSAGVTRFVLPAAGDALDERAYVIDAQDGTRNTRIVIARANVTEAVEINYKADELAVLPVTIKALAPITGDAVAFLFDDAAAFAAGS